jgi:hypothetical protein
MKRKLAISIALFSLFTFNVIAAAKYKCIEQMTGNRYEVQIAGRASSISLVDGNNNLKYISTNALGDSLHGRIHIQWHYKSFSFEPSLDPNYSTFTFVFYQIPGKSPKLRRNDLQKGSHPLKFKEFDGDCTKI